MGKEDYVSASEIGKAAWCPHGASLAARGCKADSRHKERTDRGTRSHERLTQAVVATQDRRCFVASYALGPDHVVTQQLRVWRDASLRPHWFGRAFIATYYALSPVVIRLLGWSSLFKSVSRWMVISLARSVARR